MPFVLVFFHFVSFLFSFRLYRFIYVVPGHFVSFICVAIYPCSRRVPTDKDNHKNYFNSLETYFDSEYFDTTSKNISRVCYESYDPLIHINELSNTWDTLSEKDYVEVVKHRDIPTIPITDENKIIDILVKWWEKKYGLKTGERNQNVYIFTEI